MELTDREKAFYAAGFCHDNPARAIALTQLLGVPVEVFQAAAEDGLHLMDGLLEQIELVMPAAKRAKPVFKPYLVVGADQDDYLDYPIEYHTLSEASAAANQGEPGYSFGIYQLVDEISK